MADHWLNCAARKAASLKLLANPWTSTSADLLRERSMPSSSATLNDERVIVSIGQANMKSVSGFAATIGGTPGATAAGGGEAGARAASQ